MDDVALTELSFGREYSAAIESKQVAQQEAQRAAFVVDRAIQEKQQKIVQAEGKFSSNLCSTMNLRRITFTSTLS